MRWLRAVWHRHLLVPDLLAEVTIHIRADGARSVYVPKLNSPDEATRVVSAVLGAGMDLANRFGVNVQYQPPQPPLPGT